MKTKKVSKSIIAVLLIAILILGVMPIGASAAETSSEFEYLVLDDGTAMLTSYTGDDAVVNFPETIDGYTVTAIYRSCIFYKKEIEKVIIPKTIKTLGSDDEQAYTFSGNWKIKGIVVDEDNPYYSSDNGILYNKSKTRLIFFPIAKEEAEFIIPSYVTEIADAAFIYNLNLNSVKFQGELSYIGHAAFNYMRGINYFEYPKCELDKMNGILNDCHGIIAGTSLHIDVLISKDITAINDMDFVGSDVTLYVYPDSYGLEWAQSHDFPYVIMEEPVVVEKDLIDEDTGIQVSGLVDADADLAVSSITDEHSINNANALLGDTETVKNLYDISLIKDGVKVQPEGMSEVKIPCDNENAKVYRAESDNTLTEMESNYQDGFIVFNTDHFSLYIVAEEKKAPETIGDMNKDGKIDVTDVTSIQIELANAGADYYDVVADTNKDGKVDVADVTRLQQFIAGVFAEL